MAFARRRSFGEGTVTSDQIAERLKLARQELDLTQRDMAERLGLSIGALKRIEGAGNVPSGETLLRYAEAGINPGWVLTGIGEVRLERAPAPAPATSSLDLESLTQSIQIVQDWLTQNRRTMPADRQAEVIALIYDLAMQEMADGRTTVDTQKAARFLRLVG